MLPFKLDKVVITQSAVLRSWNRSCLKLSFLKFEFLLPPHTCRSPSYDFVILNITVLLSSINLNLFLTSLMHSNKSCPIFTPCKYGAGSTPLFFGHAPHLHNTTFIPDQRILNVCKPKAIELDFNFKICYECWVNQWLCKFYFWQFERRVSEFLVVETPKLWN